MSSPTPSGNPSESPALDLKSVFRALLVPRLIEDRMLLLIRQGRLAKWFSGYGQEAIAVGAALALRPEDWILPTHRNLGVWTTRDVPLRPLFCQLMGRAGGFTKGRDRTFHFGLPEKRIVGMISHMGAMMPVACGLGQAAQVRGSESVALAFVGEGATREGDFHEAVNLAGLWKLPVVFLIENNGYGLSTPVKEAIPIKDLADAAEGYGIRGVTVDGNNVMEVISTVQKAARRARRGRGPTLIEAKTFRMRGHEEASGTKYVPPELFEKWAKKDPVDRLTRRVLKQGEFTEEEVEALRAELSLEIEEAAEYALAQPAAESAMETELADVFAAPPTMLPPPAGQRRELRFVDAVSEALRQAMERDDSVLLLGQDIAGYGGVFKVTDGFVGKFGETRVRNTPIIESGAAGALLGLALDGFKPVLEIQYADFITCAFNQIVNNLATTHYRWGAPVSITIRAPFGGSIGAGPFHSQSVEAWFCHVPGLKVVIPATPEDAKGLLLASIDDPNPVLFLEHKYLYRSVKGEVPEDPYHTPLGQARIAREGRDVTIVTYGIGVHWAIEEAAYWEGEGRSVEVVDLRTLIPWDRQTVLASVAKTNRLLVLHEAQLTGGFGAEITAAIAQEGFDLLDAPPVRVAGLDMPIPFSKPMESRVYSAKSRLRGALQQLLMY